MSRRRRLDLYAGDSMLIRVADRSKPAFRVGDEDVYASGDMRASVASDLLIRLTLLLRSPGPIRKRDLAAAISESEGARTEVMIVTGAKP
jgi:hypothetical protein